MVRIAGASIALGALVIPTAAILVARDSPCSVKCGNVLDKTTASDLTCQEPQYQSSAAGIVFEACTTCQSTSTYVAPNKQSDLQWMLYNLRYALSYCVFGDVASGDTDSGKSLGSNPCLTSTACGPLKRSLEVNSLSTNTSTPYYYCGIWDQDHVPKCSACLKSMDNGDYLRNFLTVLDGACANQPAAGSKLAIDGNMFSTTVVNITSSSAVPTFVPSVDQGPFSLGAKVGIAVGGILFIVAIAGCCVIWNGKRRRKAFLRRMEGRHGPSRSWPTPQPNTDMFETPTSQQPLRGHGWEDSPVSGHPDTEKSLPRYFSPYSSQFNSPVSAVDNPGSRQWPEAEKAQTRNIGIAISPEESHIPAGWERDAKGKERDMPSPEPYEPGNYDRDAYELQDVKSPVHYESPPPPAAPVLSHPGYGRGGRTMSGGLTENDARGGYAL